MAATNSGDLVYLELPRARPRLGYLIEGVGLVLALNATLRHWGCLNATWLRECMQNSKETGACRAIPVHSCICSL